MEGPWASKDRSVPIPQPGNEPRASGVLLSGTRIAIERPANPQPATARMFEQTFKNIDDILHKDAGSTSELDYTEQSSWLLFLKYLDALERDKAAEAALEGRGYEFILGSSHRWEVWAAPKGADGRLDHSAALTGDDLRDFSFGDGLPATACAARPAPAGCHPGSG
jgi:hypothetical protein